MPVCLCELLYVFYFYLWSNDCAFLFLLTNVWAYLFLWNNICACPPLWNNVCAFLFLWNIFCGWSFMWSNVSDCLSMRILFVPVYLCEWMCVPVHICQIQIEHVCFCDMLSAPVCFCELMFVPQSGDQSRRSTGGFCCIFLCPPSYGHQHLWMGFGKYIIMNIFLNLNWY